MSFWQEQHMKNTSSKQSVSWEHRDGIIDAQLTKIEERVNASIPNDVSKQQRKAILSEVLPHASFELNRLSLGELEDDKFVQRHVLDAVSIAEYFVKRIAATSRKC